MDYKNFLVVFSILLAIPIVKADGCGIVCPKNVTDLLTLSLATLCNFFTWGFCHIFAFIILAITGIVILVFWRKQPDEKKKTIKLLLYGLFGVFVLVIMYPYIKAFTGMAVSVTDSCSSDVLNDCYISDGGTVSHTPSLSPNYWQFKCPSFSPSEGGEASLNIITGTVVLSTTYWSPVYPTDILHSTATNLTIGSSYSIELTCTPA